MTEFAFKIDLNVLNHLGLGLYSSTPAVLTEIIANAYDAEATEVTISIDKTQHIITITDNGHGMSEDDLQNKFLNVGYARRNFSDFTLNKQRRVMGRKGIGKLAMFSLADVVEISTKQEGKEAIGVSVNVPELKSTINEHQPYKLNSITPSTKLDGSHGTVIRLSQLNKSIISTTESNLKLRLSRRFSIIGNSGELPFEIYINDDKVTIADRGFHEDVQFFWSFGGGEAEDNLKLCKNLAVDKDTKDKRLMMLDPSVPHDSGLVLRGYIASVTKPKQLKEKDTNINQISIFANGRVFQEDVLPILSNSDHFNSYLVGEIHADFLDQDEVDRATASREAIKQNDPKFMGLLGHLRTQMQKVARAWDDWRKALGYETLPDKNPFVEDWLNSLTDKRDRKSAERLIMSVYNNQFSSNQEQNDEYKKDLYRSTIIGFEKLKAKKQLARLETISSVTSPEFQAIFRSLDDMEETYYWDITNNRLHIIEKFKDIVDKKELEKVAQEYLFEHLWLLDPTWDRIKGSEHLELTLTDELKKAKPDADSGARIDIAYRNSAGRQIIIELKKPGIAPDFYKLLKQAKKYKDAVKQFLIDHPDTFHGSVDAIDICLLLEKDVAMDEDQKNMLQSANARIVTYKGLIENAFRVYQEYLNAHQKASKIEQLVQKI
ncbi:MAG: ATP-binding protein [Methylicorpusculum sp.]|uniref:BbrUII/HgiDII family restriction enzyme n=1 Tax=Methylicorpusculum sp. TaxID=2713644 RepID=UPI00272601C1|nr:ATP-binding protein [Methylicorpusculum sp.]MDO8937795.1 ATP-binding protein [Methylicorpusculum sp.]MDP2201924.1 ATP-binding protein [Methylicorpusculum sp.]